MPSKHYKVLCADCGKEFEVTDVTWRRNHRLNKPFRCYECFKKWQSNRVKAEYSNKSEEEKQSRIAKYKISVANRTDEQKEATLKHRREVWNNKSKAELDAISDKRNKTNNAKSDEEKALISERKRQALLNKSEEEREATRLKLSESQKRVWANKSEEEIDVYRERTRQRMADMNDDEKLRWKAKISESNRKTWAAKSEEDHKTHSERTKQRMASMSDADKLAWKSKISVSVKKIWDDKSEDEQRAQIKMLQDGRNEWFNSLSKDEKDDLYNAISVSNKKVWANKSNEEKESQLKLLYDARDAWWASISAVDDEIYRSKLSDAQKEIWNKRNTEEREIYSNKVSRGLIKAWANLSKNERESRKRNVSDSLMKRPLRAKIMTNQKRTKSLQNNNHGPLIQWFERQFNEWSNGKYQLVSELENHSNLDSMNQDYTILDINGNAVMLIEIDGDWSHGDRSNEYGRSSRHSKQGLQSVGPGHEQNDAERGLTIPDGIPFMVISEEYKEESFRDLTSMLGKTYDEFIQWEYQHLRNQAFPYPSYSNKNLLISYDRLRYRLKDGRNTPGTMALNGTHWDCLYGQHIMYHFYHSIWHDHIRGKLCPHDAYMNDEILMDMIRKRYILHVRNRNKITQCFLLSEEAPRVPIFTPIMGMKVLDKYSQGYDTIVDCNTQYGGVLLASLAIGKKYVGYDQDLAHHNESNKLIEWFPTVGITVDAQMMDHVPSGPCMCSYVPFGDEYIDGLLQRTRCERYVLIVPDTIKYKGSIVETYTTDDHRGEHQWHILMINTQHG